MKLTAFCCVLLSVLMAPMWLTATPPAATYVAPGMMSAEPEPDLNKIQRARILMDLIRDGNVTTPAAYASVDLAGVDVSTRYVDAVCTFFGHNPTEMTNQQKATVYINELRRWHREIYKSVYRETAITDEKAALESAEDTESFVQPIVALGTGAQPRPRR